MLAPMLRAMTLFTLLTLPQAVIAGTITYDIQNYPTDQNAWTLSGAITTDGKTGVLAPSDILSWTWTITGGPLDEVRGPIPPIIVNSTDEEAVQEFPFEIHKSLPSNGLRSSSLIKVVSLLARTYGKKRRILGQPPRAARAWPRREAHQGTGEAGQHRLDAGRHARRGKRRLSGLSLAGWSEAQLGRGGIRAEDPERHRLSVSVRKGTTFSGQWGPPERLRRDPFDHAQGSSQLAGLARARSVAAGRSDRWTEAQAVSR